MPHQIENFPKLTKSRGLAELKEKFLLLRFGTRA